MTLSRQYYDCVLIVGARGKYLDYFLDLHDQLQILFYADISLQELFIFSRF